MIGPMRLTGFVILALTALVGCAGWLNPPGRPAESPDGTPDGTPVPASSPEASATPEAIRSPASLLPLFLTDEEASASKIPIAAGPRSELFYFDPRIPELFSVPGAGANLANPSFFDDDRRIAFEQQGKIWAWDRFLEMKVGFMNVNALPGVRDPEFNASASVMAFNNPDGVYLFIREGFPWPLNGSLEIASISASAAATSAESAIPSTSHAPVPTLAPNPLVTAVLPGQVVSLAKLEAVARVHGGVVDARIDGPGDRLAVNTGDGLLWVYSLRTGALTLIPDTVQVGNGRVESIAIDPTGGLIAFGSGPHIFMVFISSGVIDPLPIANRAFNLVRAHDPTWISAREFYYLADLPDGRINQFVRYNWISETVRAAFFFNSVLGKGTNLVSDLNGP